MLLKRTDTGILNDATFRKNRSKYYAHGLLVLHCLGGDYITLHYITLHYIF